MERIFIAMERVVRNSSVDVQWVACELSVVVRVPNIGIILLGAERCIGPGCS